MTKVQKRDELHRTKGEIIIYQSEEGELNEDSTVR